MRVVLSVVLVFSFFGIAAAGEAFVGHGKVRFADAATDACLASCSSQNNSCKRVCPATLSTPCLSSCDSQEQTCKQSCQNK